MCNQADKEHIIGEDGNLYDKLDCNHGNQVNAGCVCNEGYAGEVCNQADEEHIIGDDGNLYDKLDCNHGSQVNSNCVCNEGYAGEVCNQADEEHIIGDDGNLYDKLDCNHGSQINANCVCNEGYSGYLCESIDEGYILINNKVAKIISKAPDDYNISFNNTEERNIIGLYLYDFETRESNGTPVSAGLINLTNHSNGDVYGIFSDIGYAANAKGNDGTVRINNVGNGDVYGMYDNYGKGIINAYDSKGVISIDNTGDGNVYGLYDSLYGNGSSNYGTNAEELVRISNNGKGDSYGIYSYSGSLYSGSHSVINLVNLQSGNAYGIYNSSNNAYGIYDNDIVHENNTLSVIEMANVGSGLAVGMFAKGENSNNSGDIVIHNLGEGVAIGIYTEGVVYNEGTVLIDRESYTDDMATEDTSDDVTYEAQSETGGKAIGIYGTADSTIINRGTIIINDAQTAYGIWSEGTHVTNTGTILIDGEYNENAVRLNGGKLFQDGTLIVDADWSDNGVTGYCGEHMYLEDGVCVCESGYAGASCNQADENHIIGEDGNLYDKLECNNGTQVNADCVCESGYAGEFCNQADENHIIGEDGNLYDKLECNHGAQVNADCVCESGYAGEFCNQADENHIIGEDGNLYDKLECNHGAQVNADCVCESGYAGASCNQADENHIIGEDGNLYDKLECNHGAQVNADCVCESGYVGEFCNQADENHIIGEDGNLYDKFECNHGSQVNADCVCENGYAGEFCNQADENHIIGEDGNMYDKLECNHGAQVNADCVCESGYAGEVCNQADENHIIGEDGNLYDKLECNHGNQVNDACVCNEGYAGEVCDTAATCGATYKASCGANEYTTGNTCPSGNDTLTECLAHSEMPNCQTPSTTSDTCDTCNLGWTGPTCNLPATCEGFDTSVLWQCQKVEMCKSGDTIKYKCVECAPNYELNSYKNCTRKISEIEKEQTVVGTTETINNKTLDISNDSYADVIGSKGRCNACTESETEVAFANINIINNNDGDVYGIYSLDPDMANTFVSSGDATGSINITNYGNGNVSGIFGDSINGYANAKRFYSTSPSNITSNIIINNYGDGNVYGINDSTNENPINVMCGFNKCNEDDKITGEIVINNHGNGNIYGMFSHSGIIYSILGGENKGNITSKVILINQGNGKMFGMLGMNAYNVNKGNYQSIIELVNVGDGTAIGISSSEGKQANFINNSGDIGIYNLADGVAIGIYANSATLAINTGTITITRDNYTYDGATPSDTSDDITYSSLTEKGGISIGIYGENGSKVENSGTITIAGASTSYGIYAESGARVTNTGTILIDGEYTENAIRLNGGKLFQEGVIVVNADWSNNGINGLCSNHMHLKNNVCVCDEGYAGTNCDQAADGYTLFDDVAYQTLDCANGSSQDKDHCVCGTGWTGTLCDTAAECGANYKSSCEANEYTTGNTCPSGNDTLTECLAHSEMPNCQTLSTTSDTCDTCKTGYAGTTCTQAADGYTLFDDVAYLTLDCANGSTQDKDHCTCGTGWTGTLCDTVAECNGFNLTSIPTHCQTYEQCLSGATPKYKCTQCQTGYGRNGEGNCVSKSSDKVGDGTVNVSVTINNTDYADVYGKQAYKNAEASTSTIKITNNSDADIYGMQYDDTTYNSYSRASKSSTSNPSAVTSNATIQINNTGNGNLYGIYGRRVYNAYAESYSASSTYYSRTIRAKGYIRINNDGNGNVYGIYAQQDAYNAYTNIGESNATSVPEAAIKIVNDGLGTVYGIYNSGKGSASNAYAKRITNTSSIPSSTGKIIIIQKNDGTAYGIHAYDVENAFVLNVNTFNNGTATGLILGMNEKNGSFYGMSGHFVRNVSDNTFMSISSTIKIANAQNGLAVGMYSKDGYSNRNSGDVIIHNLGDGIAIGIYADGSTKVENTGNITITRDTFTYDGGTPSNTSDDITYSSLTEKGGTAIGIYGVNGAKITNSGTITISGAQTAYGIYAESGVTVDNTGTIKIDGISCKGTNCGSANNAIKLNGAKLFQNGVMTVSSATAPQSLNTPLSTTSLSTPKNQPASLNLNDFGGTVVASNTSQFIVEGAISGDLAINNNVIENGFDTTYRVDGMIEAADVSGLNLQSQSALFDATLENNTDAVMTMKSFDSVVDNSSLADFLQNNYALANNEKLFTTLKGAETVSQLNSNIDDLFGKDMFSRMAFEDLSMVREVNFDMNNRLFEKAGSYAFGGNVSPSNYDNNIGSVGRYSLNGFNDGKRSFGLGVSITDVRTYDGNNDNSRYDRSFMMSAPMGYKTHGFELISAPKLGYANGNYDRDGFEDTTYKGKVEKRMFALMNEARYPVKFAGIKLTPSAEFNMIGYNIKGNEDEREYSLRIKSQNHYSVEAGFGLMAEKEFKPIKNHKFSINGGLSVYHEFADPYELKVGMTGMNGTYTLRDEKRSDNRAVARFGFGYEFGEDIDVTANLITNIDREYRTDAGIDMKYHF